MVKVSNTKHPTLGTDRDFFFLFVFVSVCARLCVCVLLLSDRLQTSRRTLYSKEGGREKSKDDCFSRKGSENSSEKRSSKVMV